MALHLLFIMTPLPGFLTAPPKQPLPGTSQTEYNLNWARGTPLLPPVSPARQAKRRPSPGGQQNQPLAARGADALQRQTIVSNPLQANHPRQTVLRPQALEKARVQLRDLRLPNIVIPPAPDLAPATQLDLRRLRIPRAAIPPRPKNPVELALERSRLETLYPQLAVPPSPKGAGTAPAPEVTTLAGVPRSGDLAAPGLLALSAQPAAPSPVLELPDTNLRARFRAGPHPGSGSPVGTAGGLPGATGGLDGGPGGEGGSSGSLVAPDILVTPAGAVPRGPVIVGPVSGTGPPGQPRAPESPVPQRETPSTARGEQQRSQSPDERGKAMLAAIGDASRPGEDATGRRLYTTYVYLANLTSQSSTWLLRFAEREPGNPGRPRQTAGEGKGRGKGNRISPPQAVKKVDPCYPADARWERVEGTVVIYAVIRADGGVEDVAVVRGLHARLDQRAAQAFARSRFEPARKNGRPITVEALVEIPFRFAPCL